MNDLEREETKRLNEYLDGIDRDYAEEREYPWAIASLDGEFKGKDKSGVLEIKTTNFFKSYEWKDNKIPDYYMTQVQWYLFLTGYKFAGWFPCQARLIFRRVY